MVTLFFFKFITLCFRFKGSWLESSTEMKKKRKRATNNTKNIKSIKKFKQFAYYKE